MQETQPDHFQWNFLEHMSHEAALDDEQREEVRRFWDGHFPIMLGLHGHYDFLAIAIDGPDAGSVGSGDALSGEGDFKIVAPSFDAWLTHLTNVLRSPSEPADFEGMVFANSWHPVFLAMGKMDGRGEISSNESLSRFEQDLGHGLPLGYRGFLTHYNGSRAKPNTVEIPDLALTTAVAEVFALDAENERVNLSSNRRSFRERGHERFLPIAADPHGNWFVMSLVAPEPEAVYFARRGAEEVVYPIAPSFAGFLKSLVGVISRTEGPC
jgi:hypothetical protein